MKQTFSSAKYSNCLRQILGSTMFSTDNAITFTYAAINAGLAGCCAGLATSFPGILPSNNWWIVNLYLKTLLTWLVPAPSEIKDKSSD